MSHRGGRRRCVLGMSAVLVAGLAVMAPSGAAAAHAAASPGVRAAAEVAEMRLGGKVGHLFLTGVYGGDARTPDQRIVDSYGVATPAEVVQMHHLGGVIYFAW